MPQPNRFVTARLTFRKGSTHDWEANDPILMASEPAWDTTVDALKIGDGTSKWSELEYIAREGFMDSETFGGFVHDGSVVPPIYDSLTAGIVFSSAKRKAYDLVGESNFIAGLEGNSPEYALILTAGTNGSVSHDGTNGDVFAQNAVANITATPDTGYEFDQWVGVGVTDIESATTTTTMVDNRYIRATFKLPL